METVILTAVGVGGATVVGALIGLFFKNPSHKLNDIILSFAAGVMLAAPLIFRDASPGQLRSFYVGEAQAYL